MTYLQLIKCAHSFLMKSSRNQKLTMFYLTHLKENVAIHATEINRLLKICLKEISSGFSYQKGAIFGFGPQKNNETGTILKIANLTKEELTQVDKVQVHNIGEERSVGFINYEMDIQGKKNFDSVSKKMILNKSFDLISKEGRKFKYLIHDACT